MAERAALRSGEEAKVEDVKVTVEFSKRAAIGEDFAIVVKASTTAKEKRVVRVRATVHTVMYTGVVGEMVGSKHNTSIELSKGPSRYTYTHVPPTRPNPPGTDLQ